jgi:predicted HTH transcriptional regulator
MAGGQFGTAAGALTASEGKKDDITKDVSSFANANGGTIIYAIKEFEEREQKHRPEKLDPIDGTAFTKEWLDQILRQINPRIDGVRIIPVRIEPDPNVCYVVEIPKGETAHQARDVRYYRRPVVAVARPVVDLWPGQWRADPGGGQAQL